MIKVVFQNMEKSEIAKSAALERIEFIQSKFPELQKSNQVITLKMMNSPLQAGPDLFSVKWRTSGDPYDGITIEKTSHSLYIALADVAEHALERLNRYGDKKRVKEKNMARRQMKEQMKNRSSL